MTIPEIESAICEAIDARLASGARLIFEDFGNQKTTCCALSALPIERNELYRGDDQWLIPACSFLAIERKQAVAIYSGFDDDYCQPNNEFYKLGKRIREKYYKP